MAQHSMTFADILKKNVRHVYSGLPTEIRFRKSASAVKTLDVATRIHETQKRPPDRFQRKFLEYHPEHNISLPRAPAFRVLLESDVQEIVARVNTPTNTHRRPLVTCSRETTRAAKDTCPECQLATVKRTMSRKDFEHLLRPTKSSTMRIMMRRPNAPAKYQVRPCTADERWHYPEGRTRCCVPCRIIRQSPRPQLSSLISDCTRTMSR